MTTANSKLSSPRYSAPASRSTTGLRKVHRRSIAGFPGGITTSPGLLARAAHQTVSRSGAITHPDPARETGFMIADAVRYMSVHSRKQPDSHGRSGTS